MQKDSQTNQRLIITNNPKVKAFYEEDRTGLKNRYALKFLDSRDEVFKTVRDLIHSNWKLLNHAMAGNIPLHKHPYRSMALEQQENLDTNSLILWESAMERVKEAKRRPTPMMSWKISKNWTITCFQAR